ncbi:hypothetical protein [Methylobacterium nodulans]|uniref:hypothetical protein n=1 Tax=Methylobacterium nodulans TaxID=114616 RepID=UPI000309F881|nr:hypothetical protein [Methylobacterium nodulans]
MTASAGAQLTGINFTDGAGGALTGDPATDDSGLDTVDGKSILLVADGADTVIGKYGSDDNGSLDAIAFVIRKTDVFNTDKTSDQVTFHLVTYVPIFHGHSADPDGHRGLRVQFRRRRPNDVLGHEFRFRRL